MVTFFCIINKSYVLSYAGEVSHMQVSLYTTEGLERATDALNEVTQHWNFYSIGSTVSCWLAIAAATTVCVNPP
jgi:hypothetical protein